MPSPANRPRPRPRRARPEKPAVPLGSLTQQEHQNGQSCRQCESPRVTRLKMSLTDGTPVEFTSCHVCEHRSWQHEGVQLSVESVLQRTRKPD